MQLPCYFMFLLYLKMMYDDRMLTPSEKGCAKVASSSTLQGGNSLCIAASDRVLTVGCIIASEVASVGSSIAVSTATSTATTAGRASTSV